MIDFKDVSKTYSNGTKALNNVNLHVDKGEFLFIVGASGAGKSTFLKMIMREEVPSSGSIVIDGIELNSLKAKKIPYYRRKLGIVFQDFRLIPTKTVYENIAFALHVTGTKQKEISRRVPYAMSLVGLSAKAKCYPNELSGGEQQRVALARALVNHADIIIADEPTGNIDPEMSKDIVDLLMQINQNQNTTVIMVTHEVGLIRQYDKRIVTIKNGSVVSDTSDPGLVSDIPEDEPASTAPSGYYYVPTEDAEIEKFLSSYGTEDEAPADTGSAEDVNAADGMIDSGSAVNSEPGIVSEISGEETSSTTPSGYYYVPTEDAEIEKFLSSYGMDAGSADSTGTTDEIKPAEDVSENGVESEKGTE